MADVGVEPARSSDLKDACEVCFNEDSPRLAEWFCQQCKQRLCDTCRNYHLKVSYTKNHELTRSGEGSDATSMSHADVSDEVRVPTCHLHNLAVELYCDTHNAPVCNTCKLLDHRSCKLDDIEHVIAATGTTGKHMEALLQLREIDTQMGKIGEVMANEKGGLDSKKDAIIERISRKVKEIEDLGQKKIAEVEVVFGRERECLDRETRALTQSKALVEDSIKELERVTQVGSNEDIFVATKKAENGMSRFHDILNESRHVRHAEINFEILKRLGCITTLGYVSVETSQMRVDLTPEVSEILNTADSSDFKLWLDVLPSDRLIVLSSDQMNDTCQLSLYNASKTLLSKLELPDICSAATISDHQLIVPLPETQQLQMVTIGDDKLTKGAVIDTAVKEPSLIVKYSDSSVLVVAKDQDEQTCFAILDLTGHLKKSIKPNTAFEMPLFMKMNRERNAVYIIERGKGCLGFDLEGGVIFQFTHADYNAFAGLAIDSCGAVYFSAGKGEVLTCVLKLSPAGNMLRQTDIRNTMPLQCVGNKLYLCGCDEEEEYRIISYIDI